MAAVRARGGANTTLIGVSMKRRSGIALLAVAMAAACSTDEVGPTGADPTQSFGRMRFVNAVSDATIADRVNVIVEGTPFAINLAHSVAAPASPTLYFPIYDGSRRIDVRRTADTAVHVLDASIQIAANTDHTVFAVKQGVGAAVTTFTVTDNNAAPPADSVKLRVIHLAYSAGNVDVYVTAPAASLTTISPTFANVAPGTAAAYLTQRAGTYQVRLTAPGSKTAILTITTPALAAGAIRTAVALDPQTGTALVGALLTDR
ncbi:MAG: DUF4397 domain-containing protein [Gemmatimonadaceae bacterium]